MTLKEYIEVLTDLAEEEFDTLEVVATDPDSGETYTPVISVGPDKDGVRRMFVS